MSKNMTCDDLADMLAEYLDGDTDDGTKARVDAHAASCAECGALLADLRRLRTDAAALPELAPSRDLWSGISARIETPVVELNNARAPRMPDVYDVRLRRLWLGLAAAVLVGTTATITRVMTARSMTEQAVPRAQTTSEGAGSVANVANRPASEVAYDQEIAQLRAVLNKQRPMLDTATIAVVEKNLAVIDEAIAQCTQALRRDPASGYLIESLHEALESKVQLLRTATRLASRS